MRGRWTNWLVLAALVSTFGLTEAWGQASRGAIRGEVVDAEGAALPGVQVTVSSPALIQSRSVVTGPNGEFNVPALPIGTYAIEASLASFAPSKQENVRVLLGGTTTVKLTMRQEMAASIEVTGEAVPTIDPTETGTGGRVTYEELLKVPTARDPWAVLSMVPGVQVDRVNVGGSESGQQATFSAKGDDGSNTTWTIDGVTITDAGALGSSPLYYDFGAIEEIQVTTGGNDASQLTGGIGLNIVTKRGSNEIHGSARGLFTGHALQDKNISGKLAAALPSGKLGNRIDQILEFGGEVGGPIVKDRLWFWGSANRNKIEQLTISSFPDNTELVNYGGKISGQVTSENEANVFYTFGDKKKEGRNVGPTRPPNTAWNQGGGTPVIKVEDQQIFGSDTLLAAKFAHVGGGFHLYPAGGSLVKGTDNVPIAAIDISTNIWDNKNYVTYITDRPQDMFHVDGSHFHSLGGVDNDFKFGFAFRHTPVESRSFWDKGGYVTYGREAFGLWPTAAAVFPDFDVKYVANTISLYGSDTITKGSLTLDVGLRFDRQAAKNGESVRKTNEILPDVFDALTYPGSDTIATYSFVSPRIGATYQLGDKTLVKANYALYADQIGASIATALNPVGYSYAYVYFDDANGDLTPQPDELLSLPGYPCGGRCYYAAYFDPNNPDIAINQVDDNLGTPKTHEVILGITREIVKDVSLGVNATYRRRFNDTIALPLVVDETAGSTRPITFADWVSNGSVSGNTTRYPQLLTGNYEGKYVVGNYTLPLYTLRDGLHLYNGATFTTNRDGYHESYKGLEFVLQKRYSNRWSFAANFSLNDWTKSFTVGGAGDYPVPNRSIGNEGIDGGDVTVNVGEGSGAKGNVFLNSNWQGSVRGSYTIPKVDVDLGANLLVRQGYPTPFVHRAVTAIPGDTSPFTRLIINPDVTTFRHDSLVDLDLHVGKELNFTDSIGLELGADLFNVFNSDTLLQQERRANTSTFLSPREILAPRILRVSARLKF